MLILKRLWIVKSPKGSNFHLKLAPIFAPFFEKDDRFSPLLRCIQPNLILKNLLATKGRMVSLESFNFPLLHFAQLDAQKFTCYGGLNC